MPAALLSPVQVFLVRLAGHHPATAVPLDDERVGHVLRPSCATLPGAISAYEVWNEPENNNNGAITPAIYAQLLNETAPAVRQYSSAGGQTFPGVTHTAASTSYAAVSAAVAAASAGDTVIVPAGSSTWTSTLVITKGILLQGAGIGNTVITGNIPADGTYRWINQPIVAYYPSNYALNSPFRLTGFTFNINTSNDGVALGYQGGPSAPFTAQTSVRVDHNRFTNSTTNAYHAAWCYGAMYGVFDHNTVDAIVYPFRNSPQVPNGTYWDNYPYTPGGSDNMYYEDNTISGVGQGAVAAVVSDCQYSGRYAYRYNNISIVNNGEPLFDMHGNQGGTMWSGMGGEIYGNKFTCGSCYGRLAQQRGGKMMIFGNDLDSSAPAGEWDINVEEEYKDSDNPTVNQPPAREQFLLLGKQNE